MAKPEELAFIHLIYIGIVAFLTLAIAVVVFVVLHQRKAHLLQGQLRQQELEYQSLMLQAVVASQESERERIARDLHDEIGASLSTARLFVSQMQYEATSPHLQEMAQQAGQILSGTLQNVWHIVQDLSPTLLANYGFRRAVATQVAGLEASGVQVEAKLDEAVEHLNAAAQLVLYRIVQELLANIGKHAQARCVTLYLQAAADRLLLTVTDDGCGFTPELARAAAAGMGLVGMQARAQLLGGHLALASAPGSGTCITLTVPR